MTVDKIWLENQVDTYFREELPRYRVFAQLLEMVFKHACERFEIIGIVNSRSKAVPSFAEKAIRKSHKYDDPIHQLTDLCGVRVITNTQKETDQIVTFIRENFRVDEENSLDLRTMLKAEEFGYRSVHYVVQLKRDAPEVRDIVKEMTDENGEIDYFSMIGDRKAEVQVRTLLQHAWAMISHDRFYKSDFEVPEYFRRELARVAALLESADEEFGNAIHGIDEYKLNYGSYMSREQISEEVEKWEMVLSHDKRNVKLAHRIGQLAIAMEDWDRALRIMEPFGNSGKAYILRDTGIALTKAGRNGREELKTAVELDPDDVEAWCALGDSWKGKDDGRALEHYKKAFHLAPTDPHILGSYLEARLRLSTNIDFIPLMFPTLEYAIRICRKLADAHVYLPWAFYDIAKFSLLLNRPYDSLDALTKAVTLSDSVFPIKMALDSMMVFETPILGSASYVPDFQDLGWAMDAVKRYLGAAIVVKHYRNEQTALQRSLRSDSAAPELRKTLSQSRDELTLAIRHYLHDLVVEELSPDDGPFIIVAGGCSADVQEEMEGYRESLETAFECYSGTVISGASRAGISGIVGDLATCSDDTVRKIGYVPGIQPKDFEPHLNFDSFTSKPIAKSSRIPHDFHEPSEFTPLEPLQGWIDLLAGGVKPWNVRILGINGGAISAFEYRMALSFGATVGILKSSGRSAAELQLDVQWWGAPGLLWLPKDKMALRAFVNPGESCLEREQIERIGTVIHEKFLEEHRYTNIDPAMMQWEELREDLKQSNRAQAVYAEKILRSVGYEVRETAEHVDYPEFTDDEIERMAEMEHGRWIVERLRSGWSYGPNREPKEMISPYIVPWNDLPEEVKEYDRRAVRGYPECLRMAGLGVYRLD